MTPCSHSHSTRSGVLWPARDCPTPATAAAAAGGLAGERASSGPPATQPRPLACRRGPARPVEQATPPECRSGARAATGAGLHWCRGPPGAAAPGLMRDGTGSGSWLCRRGCIRAVAGPGVRAAARIPRDAARPETARLRPRTRRTAQAGRPACRPARSAFFLGRQNWLACPLLQCGQIGVRVTTEAGPQGPGVAPAVETLAECGPSLPADPTQLAHSRWAQPRCRGRDQAHLPTQHGGRGGRFAPIGPALVVALRPEQMLEVVVRPRQAGQRVTMEQPGFVAAGHLAEVLDSVRERPRLAGVPVHGRDQPVEAAPDKASVLLDG